MYNIILYLVRIFSARAFAVFHHINAFEEDGQVVVDVCAADGTLYKSLFLKALEEGNANIPLSEPIR